MISHADLSRLATRGHEMFFQGPGLGWRVEPSCFATETRRMAETYLRLSGYVPGSDEKQAAIIDALERAFTSGFAMGLAHHEEQRRELLIEFARWSLRDESEALAVIDMLNVGSFESMADDFLEQRGAS